MTDAMRALAARMDEQNEHMGAPLFTFDRNGLRLAIAAIEDETAELYEEWSHNKRHLDNGILGIKHELLDVAAVAMLAYIEVTIAEKDHE